MFFKLHRTAQFDPVIVVIPCHSDCASQADLCGTCLCICVCVFIINNKILFIGGNNINTVTQYRDQRWNLAHDQFLLFAYMYNNRGKFFSLSTRSGKQPYNGKFKRSGCHREGYWNGLTPYQVLTAIIVCKTILLIVFFAAPVAQRYHVTSDTLSTRSGKQPYNGKFKRSGCHREGYWNGLTPYQVLTAIIVCKTILLLLLIPPPPPPTFFCLPKPLFLYGSIVLLSTLVLSS